MPTKSEHFCQRVRLSLLFMLQFDCASCCCSYCRHRCYCCCCDRYGRRCCRSISASSSCTEGRWAPENGPPVIMRQVLPSFFLLFAQVLPPHWLSSLSPTLSVEKFKTETSEPCRHKDLNTGHTKTTICNSQHHK